MLHNETYFSNPHSFIPERWIESERGNETCVKKAWIAFSYGKWDCIGKPYLPSRDVWRGLICRLAMMEMRVTLAKLIWQFDVTLKTAGQEEPRFNHRAVAAGELEVRLRKVERS